MMKILIGYDGLPGADAALDDLKRAGLPREAQALIVSVADPLIAPGTANYGFVEEALKTRRVTTSIMMVQKETARVLLEAKAFTTKAGERVRSYFPDWHVRSQVLTGPPATELIRSADEWKPDLVVVGSHKHSLAGRIILGSVSRKIVTDSNHSVRVTRDLLERDAFDPLRIMIGVDGSCEARHAVNAVGHRVWPYGAEVRIVLVEQGNTAAAAHSMIEWAKEELSVIGLKVSFAIEKGEPRRVLISEAQKWQADAIFVGGRRFANALERFRLGSVATSLVINAPCTVEVVRSHSLAQTA